MADAGHNLCVTITTGRSGSVFLYNLFRHNYPEEGGLLHESLHPGRTKAALHHRRFDESALEQPYVRSHFDALDALRAKGPVVDFGWVLGCLAPALTKRFSPQLRVLALTAHPVSVAASFANRGHYSRNSNQAWAISPFHDNVRFPGYRARWEKMSPFERGLFRWLEITSLGIEFAERHPEVPVLAMRSDELFADRKRATQVAELVGLPARDMDFDVPRNESVENHVERRPVGDEWQRTFDMPEVVDLAQRLGFDMSPATVAGKVAKYQLQGWLPKFRHATGYWAVREELGRLRDRALGRGGARKRGRT